MDNTTEAAKLAQSLVKARFSDEGAAQTETILSDLGAICSTVMRTIERSNIRGLTSVSEAEEVIFFSGILGREDLFVEALGRALHLAIDDGPALYRISCLAISAWRNRIVANRGDAFVVSIESIFVDLVGPNKWSKILDKMLERNALSESERYLFCSA